MKQSGKKATKKTTKKAARKSAAPKTAAKKQAAKGNGKATGKRSGKKRRTIKSTVPPQFRAMPKMDAKDPQYWELREQFKKYFQSLSEKEAENFAKGLKRPFLDYLIIDLARERHAKGEFISIRGD
jgi:hypothetical protein